MTLLRPKDAPFSEQELAAITHVRKQTESFKQYADDIGSSRELSQAKTKMDEACLWFEKHFTGAPTYEP